MTDPVELAEKHRVTVHDLMPPPEDFAAEVRDGLSKTPKSLPCKYFYDQRGSELFNAICALAEYYPTRTEIALLESRAAEIASLIGPHCRLIELGSGSSRKIRILLDALAEPAGYVAVDISREQLLASAARLADDYPKLEIMAVCADYTRPFDLPLPGGREAAKPVVFFPGSTVGNFSPQEAIEFLRMIATLLHGGGELLIGVDVKKDSRILDAAYNDSQGVTAAFNLNLLERINRELDADFDLSAFHHLAFYNEACGRIEMHLESGRAQSVRIGRERVRFAAGERIHTENSYKYGVEEFQLLARRAGFVPVRVWTDPDRLFSIHCLRAP